MKRISRWRLPSLLVFSLIAAGQERLPVKRVVLYKNGVGYFEHLGRVRDNQDVAISFTSGQLNDVLKSLTVLDLNGGRITGVGYGSAAPVERQLGDLRLPVSEKTSLTEFLGSLRGARLEVKSGNATIAGRLLSVERKTRMGGGATLEVDYLALLTDNGEVRTTEIGPQFSVRLVERGLAGKVDRLLDLMSASREADVRRMVVSTEGTGERNVFVSYISEVPVWKATYRIVLGSKPGASPLLQGWAIVDNTVGQDWEKVQLSLVAGAPQSFIQNLSQPYYARRPMVALPESANISPQTYQSTLMPGGGRLSGKVTDPGGASIAGVRIKVSDASGAPAGETTSDASGNYELAGLPEGPVRIEAEMEGFRRKVMTGITVSPIAPARGDLTMNVGSVTEMIEVRAGPPQMQSMQSETSSGASRSGSGRTLGGRSGILKAPAPPPPPGYSVSAARANSAPAAAAQALGDLFEYKLREPVSILKNRSALVPIVQSAIGAERVSIWNEQAGLPRPQRALRLTNTSGLTLDGGSFSVLEEETFAGEGVFEPIHPGEKRLVSYATDLAITAGSRESSEHQHVTRVRVAKGIMTHESEVREKKTYTFRNEDGARRTVVVEHPVRAGYQLRSSVKPVETTAGWMRFEVPVGAKQTASLVVEEARAIKAHYPLAQIMPDQVGVFVRERSISKEVEEALRRVLAQKSVASKLGEEISARENEESDIFDDQQRLRENMKALKGSPEERTLLQRYTKQLNDQENRLEALKKEHEALQAQRDAAQGALDKLLEDLVFDVTL